MVSTAPVKPVRSVERDAEALTEDEAEWLEDMALLDANDDPGQLAVTAVAKQRVSQQRPGGSPVVEKEAVVPEHTRKRSLGLDGEAATASTPPPRMENGAGLRPAQADERKLRVQAESSTTPTHGAPRVKSPAARPTPPQPGSVDWRGVSLYENHEPLPPAFAFCRWASEPT